MDLLEIIGFSYTFAIAISLASIIGFFIVVGKVISIDKTLRHIKEILLAQYDLEIKE